jgi:phosphate/sulfate permease
MAIAGFLTFLGLLIAAYSILKTHEKLFIRLRLSLLDKILIPIFTIVIFLLIIWSDQKIFLT